MAASAGHGSATATVQQAAVAVVAAAATPAGTAISWDALRAAALVAIDQLPWLTPAMQHRQLGQVPVTQQQQQQPHQQQQQQGALRQAQQQQQQQQHELQTVQSRQQHGWLQQRRWQWQSQTQLWPTQCLNQQQQLTRLLPTHQQSLQRLQQQQQWHSGHQLQQCRCYHPAQHRARALTTQLLQQQKWQDLQLMHDSEGGARGLNPYHLVTLLQQLSKLAPTLAEAPAAERDNLKKFTAELVAACEVNAKKLDLVGLGILASSLARLGSLNTSGSSSGSSGGDGDSSNSTQIPATPGSSSSLLTDQMLSTVVKLVPTAGGSGTCLVFSALATLLAQQQQQLTNQQQQLAHRLTSVVMARVGALLDAGKLSYSDATGICVAAGRIFTILQFHDSIKRRSAARHGRTTAASDAQKVVVMTIKCVMQANLAMPNQLTAADVSMLVHSLAKSQTWPYWDTVQRLITMFVSAMDYSVQSGSAAVAASHAAQPLAYPRRGRLGAAHHSKCDADVSLKADSTAPIPQFMWGLGRLLENHQRQQERQQRWWQQQQQQQDGLPSDAAAAPNLLRWQQQQQQWQQQIVLRVLLEHSKLWQPLNRTLTVGMTLLQSLDPLQLTQLVGGLARLVSCSKALLERAQSVVDQCTSPIDAADSAVGMGSDVRANIQTACKQLEAQLASQTVKRLLQQHVKRAEGLLPLTTVSTRRQLAQNYQQLEVHIPRGMRLVFERDAATAGGK